MVSQACLVSPRGEAASTTSSDMYAYRSALLSVSATDRVYIKHAGGFCHPPTGG